MSQELQEKSTASDLSELARIFGPPPVLNTESSDAYHEMMARLMQDFKPTDFLGQTLIKQLTDCTWEMSRYTRHKTLAVERTFGKELQTKVNRSRISALRKEEQARKGVGETALDRMRDLEDVINNVTKDIDGILNQVPVELDHARAFEGTIEYYEKLDKLLSVATMRRNDAVQQLEWYKDGLGGQLRKASDEILKVELHEPQSEQVAPPLVPAVE